MKLDDNRKIDFLELIKVKIDNFFNSKNKEFEITKKIASKDFLFKCAAILILGTIMILNLIFESISFLLSFLSGYPYFNIFGILNPIYIFKFLPIYFLVLLFVLIIYAKTVINIRSSFNEIEDGQKGTARFATREEIHQQYRNIPIKDESFSGKGGIPIARGFIDKNGNAVDYKENEHTEKYMKSLGIKEVMYIDDGAVNNLIIGTTRSGKGETFVVPTIDIYSRAENKASMIINDPKGELIAMSKDTLEKRGYDVLLLNLTDPINSMSYNPLNLIIEAYKKGDYGEAQLLCQTLTYSIFNDPNVKDTFWQNTAMSLTNALILALCEEYLPKGNPEEYQEEKITLYTVANMLSNLGKVKMIGPNEVYPIDQYFDSLPIDSVARLQYSTTQFAKSSTKGSILVSTMNRLSMFTFEKTAKMTSINSLNFKDIGFGNGKPKAIFMVTPDYDKSIHVLASIFVRQVYYVLAKNSTMSKAGKCDREVVFLLDEFGNMPPIEGMSNIITVCLGRNIRFNLIIQAYNQLKQLYGDDSATIEGNCGNQIYILTNDDETAEKYSRLIGEKTIISHSRSGEVFSTSKSHSENLDSRRLLKSDELRKLKEGENIIVRVIKRSDIDNKKIVPNPIFNKGDYSMKYRYQYLFDTFSNKKSFLDIKVNSKHENIKLVNVSEDIKNKTNKKYVENNLEKIMDIKDRAVISVDKDNGMSEIYLSEDNKEYIIKSLISSDMNVSDDVINIIENSNRYSDLKIIPDKKILKEIESYINDFNNDKEISPFNVKIIEYLDRYFSYNLTEDIKKNILYAKSISDFEKISDDNIKRDVIAYVKRYNTGGEIEHE